MEAAILFNHPSVRVTLADGVVRIEPRATPISLSGPDARALAEAILANVPA